MHRSVIPCQRRNLPLNSVGNVIKAITPTIIGISIICEVLYPKSLLPSGITNGEIVTAVPDTSTKLKILALMILPNDKAPCPLASAVIAVTSSGRAVQRATTVTPITSVGIPAMVANETEDASNISAPKAINAALIISYDAAIVLIDTIRKNFSCMVMVVLRVSMLNLALTVALVEKLLFHCH